jgi:hypothetical protein
LESALNQDDDIYQPPSSNIEKDEGENNKSWAGLAAFTLLVILFNTLLIISTIDDPEEFKSVSGLIGFVLGGVLVFPIIFFAVSQIWKKWRNGRDRVKAILYPSFLVLFSQLASCIR